MRKSERINLILRVTMETGIVVALGFWGYRAGSGPAAKIALMIAVPLIGFGFWGTVDFHQAGRLAEPLRLTQELVISGLAALPGMPLVNRHLASRSAHSRSSTTRSCTPRARAC